MTYISWEIIWLTVVVAALSYLLYQIKDNKPVHGRVQLNAKQGIFLYSCIFLPLSLAVLNIDWNDFKGAIFVRRSELIASKGIIISSSIEFQPGSGKTEPSWRPKIIYDYSVRNKIYQSNQVTFSPLKTANNPRYAQNYIQKYPAGCEVTVYYRPSQPSFAVLEPNQTEGALPIFLGFSLLAVLSVAGITWSVWK